MTELCQAPGSADWGLLGLVSRMLHSHPACPPFRLPPPASGSYLILQPSFVNLKKSSLAPGETISSTVAPLAQGWPGLAGGPVPPAPTCPAVPVSPGWARDAGGSEKGCMAPWPPKTLHQGEPGTCGFWGPPRDLSQW